jgi:hypothetical protein
MLGLAWIHGKETTDTGEDIDSVGTRTPEILIR